VTGRWIIAAAIACGACGASDDRSTREVGTVAIELDVRKSVVRSRETLAADLVAEAVHRGIPGAQVVLINGGNLRFDPITRADGRYPAGPWTEKTIAEFLPFDFDVDGSQVVVTLTGAQLKSTLERSVASLQEVAPPDTAVDQLKGWFLSGWGVRYTADLSRQPQVLNDALTQIVIEGDRVTELTVGGVAVEPSATYRVSGTQFMMTGMDGHVALVAGTDRDVLGRTSADMLVDYLTSASPVTPVLDGRVVIEQRGD